MLAHVGAHADGVQHEVNFAAQHIHALFKDLLQVVYAGSVGCNDGSANLFGQLVERTHAQCHGRVAEGELGTFLGSAYGYLPGNGVFVERAKDDTALPFK